MIVITRWQWSTPINLALIGPYDHPYEPLGHLLSDHHIALTVVGDTLIEGWLQPDHVLAVLAALAGRGGCAQVSPLFWDGVAFICRVHGIDLWVGRMQLMGVGRWMPHICLGWHSMIGYSLSGACILWVWIGWQMGMMICLGAMRMFAHLSRNSTAGQTSQGQLDFNCPQDWPPVWEYGHILVAEP